MIKNVTYPAHVLKGVYPLRRKTPELQNLRVFGMDTETNRGSPVSIQICGPEDAYFGYVSPDNILSVFCNWVFPRLRDHGVNLCYVHNLSFDLRVLFCSQHRKMYEQFSEVAFESDISGGERVSVSMLYGKINKATLRMNGMKLDILDSRAFTLGSLAASLKMFGVSAVKVEAPEDLGYIDFGSLAPDDPKRLAFEEYSRNDALAERLLGEKILEFHREYNVGPSISLPSYAAKVFRKHFLPEPLPFPPLEIAKAAELSFHGGKNGKYDEGPRVYEDLSEVDINSAYPAAMRSFPGLTRGDFETVNEFTPGYLGIYCLSGCVTDSCKYPLIFDHEFKRVRGDFSDLWTTGYETELALRPESGVRITSIRGFVWRPIEGAVNPFAAFVDHFYGLKEKTPKADPHYHFYKIVLNALFGKTIAASEQKSFEQEKMETELRELGVDLPDSARIDDRWDPVLGRAVRVKRQWRAGSLYSPFIATQITGHARAELYKLEVAHNAVHAATDSIKTFDFIEPKKGLGGFKLECRGRCYIFRNKLYLHFAKDYSRCDHEKTPIKYPEKKFVEAEGGVIRYLRHPRANEPLVDTDGQHLCKFALHGYKGPLWVLFENRHELIRTGKMRYQYIHVIGLREGMRQNLKPCDFVIHTEDLELDLEKDLREGDSINDREEVAQ